MKQMKKKLGLLLFCIMFMFAIPVMAKDVTEQKKIEIPTQKAEYSIVNQNARISTNDLKYLTEMNQNMATSKYASDTRFLNEILPRENDVIRKGEQLYVKFIAKDTWKYYYTKPLISIFDSDSEIVYTNFYQNTVPLYGQTTYSGYISWDTSSVEPGVYSIFIVNAPCYANGTLVSNWASFNCPYINTYFTLKEAPHTHTYGAWKTVKAATVFETGKKEHSCTSCGQKESQSIPKLKATIKLSTTKKTIGINKTYTLKITNLAKGDSIKSIKSSKTSIAAVKKLKTNQYKITGKKKGTATITVVLKSGKKATCKITVK